MIETSPDEPEEDAGDEDDEGIEPDYFVRSKYRNCMFPQGPYCAPTTSKVNVNELENKSQVTSRATFREENGSRHSVHEHVFHH